LAIKLSKRVQLIKPSPTLAVTAKAAELQEAGKDIIGLGAGEPDFDTPEHIKQAAIAAIQQGFTKYTDVGGTKSLKTAIVNKLKTENNLNYTTAEILVSCGAKQSIYNLMQSLLDKDDEVIIPAPYWVSYTDMTILAEAKPVVIETNINQHFKISAAQLEKAITTKTKLFIINSPSNPSGMAYTKEELSHLAAVLVKHPEIIIVSDDIYEHILWPQHSFVNILNACPELKNQTVIVNGVSKSYAMTGWRIGYAAGPIDLIKAMNKIQGQSTSNPCSISQKAAEASLTGGIACVNEMVKHFKQRHDYLVAELNKIPGFKCLTGDGTFYAFPYVQELINKIPGINNDTNLAEKLLSDAEVAVVPGFAFGASGYIRLSFATSMEMLEKAVVRIKAFASKYMD
jgi:aspartate aminotransferase